MRKETKNPLWSCLTYQPPVKATKKDKEEAIKEIEEEKKKRRLLHDTNLEEWKKYKEETKGRIQYLNSIIQTGMK